MQRVTTPSFTPGPAMCATLRMTPCHEPHPSGSAGRKTGVTHRRLPTLYQYILSSTSSLIEARGLTDRLGKRHLDASRTQILRVEREQV